MTIMERNEMERNEMERLELGRAPIHDLPYTVFTEIGAWLHRRDLLALMLTSKQFHAIFEKELYKDKKALWVAGSSCNFVVARKLIKFGCYLDSSIHSFESITSLDYPMTPLVFSMLRKNVAMAAVLVTAGANVDIAPNASSIPVFLALQNKWFNIFKLMVSASKADLTVVNQAGYGLLTEAARLNDMDVVPYLLSFSSRLGVKGKERSTPLHQAIQNGNLKMFSMLLKSLHVSPNTPCAGGKTPLELACEKGLLTFVVPLLDDSQTNPQLSTSDKNCLVLRALKKQNFELVTLLLTHANPCWPSKSVFTKACDMKKELIAWKVFEMLNLSKKQAEKCKIRAEANGLLDLCNMMTMAPRFRKE